MKLDQNVCLMKSGTSLELGHVGSKTRSRGQILENLVYALEATLYSLILMKLGQNACLEKILEEFKSGLCGIKS